MSLLVPSDGTTRKEDAQEQVDEDPELLRLMMSDSRAALPIYQATNHWQFMERKLTPELRRLGLKDFRRRPRSPLQSFGCVDRLPLPPHIDLFNYRLLNNRYTVRISGYEPLLEHIGLAISQKLPIVSGIKLRAIDLEKIAFERAEFYASKWGAPPLSNISASIVGNPEWTFEKYGNIYTMSFIQKFIHYAYASQFINFDDVNLFVELGGGAARQIEVILKMHPNMTIMLFDIPPQIYVGQKYLEAVFPGRVVSYRETREYRNMPSPEKGMIYVFGSQQFPLLENASADLFWDAASFQEMEPDAAANYLYCVNRFAKAVFLQEIMAGRPFLAPVGKLGVLKKTVENDYHVGLPDFECIDMSPIIDPVQGEAEDKPGNYFNSFWRRRRES